MLFRSTFKSFLSILLISSGVHFASAQTEDASQLGFTGLQTQANALVEEGELVKAMPLLKELVKRVEMAEKSDIELDFPMFLIGTGHIQLYLQSGRVEELNSALEWYAKLEKDFPESKKMKDMLMKRIDVLRALKRNDEAIATMQKILSGGYPSVRLNYSEQIKMLKDLTQIYYNTGQLEAGLPYFGQLLEIARDPEDQALAAAASFEALFKAKRLDDALKLLPMLAKESSVRYRPRLNVALLIASDTLVDAGRLNDAALTLNLIKTTDIMIEYHEAQIQQKTDRVEQRIAFGNAEEEVEKLQQEIKILEANLEHLRKLPTLRNELLVRRARNYTKTARRFEAFWMFYDLMVENPNDPQAEFYNYATFSNALQIHKTDTAIKVGRSYRQKFPNGDYYSDVSAALAVQLKDLGNDKEFMELAVNFLGSRPQDAVSRSLFAQWASYLIEQQRYVELITQAAEWYNAHRNSIYEDGIFYWGGLAELQMSQFEDAVGSFSRLVDQYPQSVYAEDGLLRKGAALYYAQRYEESRETLLGYVKKYPQGKVLDQAYFFLGEVEYLAGNFELALQHFNEADDLTSSQELHNGTTFRIGTLLEELGRYEEMASHFENYITLYGEKGDLTRAVLQLGRAFEYLMRPVEMLTLYRENIEKFASDPENTGVDALIEGYAEKYNKNLTVLSSTADFFKKLEDDKEFREKIVTDRGFLFEYFYVNQDLDQPLYNKLRNDPDFTTELLEDLSPIHDIMAPYKEQLSIYPSEKPEDYFQELLAKARAKNDIVEETRMLMGLYRLNIELAPSRAFDSALVEILTPRAILYVADYERDKRLSFAESAWNLILQKYPSDDTAIVSYMRLADIAAEKNQPSDALNYLDQIVTQFPGSPKLPAVILRQGELLSQMGRGKEAREKYQYMLRVPGWRGVLQARALYQTGESYMEESAYAEAHGFFERTFLGYPHLAEWCAKAYLADAEALLAMGEKQDAITTLTEATQELSEDTPAEILTAIQTKLKELQP
jgi:TolA-binding protein